MRGVFSSQSGLGLRLQPLGKPFAAAFLIAALVNLPYRYGEYRSLTLGFNNDLQPSLHIRPSASVGAIYGGWPFRYVASSGGSIAVASPTPDEIPPMRQSYFASLMTGAAWSPDLLFLNLLLGAAAALAAAAATVRLPRTAAVAGVCGIGAGVFCLGTTAYRDAQIARSLTAKGTIHRSAVVPTVVNRLFPSISLEVFSRTRGVMFHRFDEECYSHALEMPHLTALGFCRHSPTPDQLAMFGNRFELTQVCLYELEVDPHLREFIAGQRRLQHLVLAGCSGLTDGLPELKQLEQLCFVDAVDSDLALAALSDSGWAKRLEQLHVSPPIAGPDRLELQDCRELKVLSVVRTDPVLNAEPVSLSLERMPQLRSLSLATTQKMDLTIVNSPRLDQLVLDQRRDQIAEAGLTNVPANLWARRVRLFDVPSLKRFHCFGLDIERIEIREVPNLVSLTVDADLIGNNGMRTQFPGVSARMATLVRDLSRCDCPPILDLSTLPLQGVDLSELAGRQRIRELGLAGTGVNGRQLHELLELPHLIALDVTDCPLHAGDIAAVLQQRPNLKRFRVDAQGMSILEVVDKENLTDFVQGPVTAASIVRISGSPNLASDLLLGNRLKQLEIRNAAALQGLAVDGPIPPGTILEGFRGLRFCSLGGPAVDDSLCAPLWSCPRLSHLTLAHTNLSRESFARIADIESLITLIVPGNGIDDSMTRDWGRLRFLAEVNLSQNPISDETLAVLLSFPNLQRLAVNYTNLDASDLTRVADVGQLIELEVAGVGLEPETLESLLERKLIDRLDLSDCPLSSEHIACLCDQSTRSLVFLGLSNCSLGDDEIRRIAESQPLAAFDISGNAISDGLYAELERSGRLMARNNRSDFLRRVAGCQHAPAMLKSEGVATVIAALRDNGIEWGEDTCPGRIDVDRFAPADTLTVSIR